MSSTSETPQRLQPNIAKLGEAFKVLSDELPLLSNIDTVAILDALLDIRKDIQKIAAAQQDLESQLEKKLAAIHDTLASLEHPVGGLESSSQSGAFGRQAILKDTSLPKIKQEDSIQSIKLGGVDPDKKTTLKSPPQAVRHIRYQKQGIFSGPSGALIVIIVTFIPILLALFRPEIFDSYAA